MPDIDEGGPAFPGEAVVETAIGFGDASGYREGIPATKRVQMPGMSLRDWFAGQALAGMEANMRRRVAYGLLPDTTSLLGAEIETVRAALAAFPAQPESKL